MLHAEVRVSAIQVSVIERSSIAYMVAFSGDHHAYFHALHHIQCLTCYYILISKAFLRCSDNDSRRESCRGSRHKSCREFRRDPSGKPTRTSMSNLPDIQSDLVRNFNEIFR